MPSPVTSQNGTVETREREPASESGRYKGRGGTNLKVGHYKEKNKDKGKPNGKGNDIGRGRPKMAKCIVPLHLNSA